MQARTTTMPACTLYVDAANNGAASGTKTQPFKTIAAAITAASNGAVICVAQGTYSEELRPADKNFTLAGGFQAGFNTRDSAQFVSKAQGTAVGQVFFKIADPDLGPAGDNATVIDGFEITGYSQAIVREYYEEARFDITNNFIHDNDCAGTEWGGAFSLNNVKGTISGNVIARNTCGRGGGGLVYDDVDTGVLTVTNNWIDANIGDDPGDSHGGGLNLMVATLTVSNNLFTNNEVTGWGGGLYVGADNNQNLHTMATLSGNVYRDNKAGDAGGGLFCDDAATCNSAREIYDSNCGGNVMLDNGDGAPTIANLSFMTNFGARSTDCSEPGFGIVTTKNNDEADAYTITDSIFWNNKVGADIYASCAPGNNCAAVTITVSRSLVQTTYVSDGATVTFGSGNVTPVDPKFVNVESDDFHLQPSSPVLQLGAYGN